VPNGLFLNTREGVEELKFTERLLPASGMAKTHSTIGLMNLHGKKLLVPFLFQKLEYDP
jgi:hypothetical protein